MPLGMNSTMRMSRAAYTATSRPVTPWRKPRNAGGSRSTFAIHSESGPTTSAPTTGPNTVPMPPMTAGTIALTETADPKACSGPTKK